MFELVCWCDGCHAESVFELVPDAEGEYVCRKCAAAAVIDEGTTTVRHLAGAA